jgi:hypothetical protein
MENMEKGKIKKEREALIKEIKALPPGPEALKKLAYYREEYDFSNEDYVNTLKILSDTTYQDRKHFLLELIQNADDATYEEKEAKIRFIIKEYNLELRYNESGFDTDDVIAITGAGASTKTGKRKLSHSFIGEKGIGFKSVFALASEVEIESPPWNFTLRKEKCVVPQILTSKKLKESHGTRIEVHFDKQDIINNIAKELFRFVDGQIESFLFLQTLSEFSVEDHREKPIKEYRVVITPPDRSGKFLKLQTFPGNQQRTYFYYSEDVLFPAERVAERWEKIGPELGALSRKIIVAIPQSDNDSSLKNGALFCFLPTKITLPVPFFLHVDGVTTADRERLQIPENNRWNDHLFKFLPEILLNSILEMRKYPDMIDQIQNFIPITSGTEQLQGVFEALILKLRTTPWIRLFNNDKIEWATPAEVIQIDDFWIFCFGQYPEFRKSAEKTIGKKFVSPLWTKLKTWKTIREFYCIPMVTDMQVANIIAGCNLPSDFMQNEDLFLIFYTYINSLLKNSNIDSKGKIQKILLKAEIYPIEGGKFGPLQTEKHKGNVYWISEKNRRQTGLDNKDDYRIINTEYTYKPKIEQDFPEEKKNALSKIEDRNKIVRNLLQELGIEELDDKQILSDLQIPWLLDEKRVDDKEYSTLYSVLLILFNSYRAKRNRKDDPDYVNELSKISKVRIPSINGTLQPLENLILPEELRLEPFDNLYSESGLGTIKLPKKFLEISEKDTIVKVDDREFDKKLKKIREDLRSFLIRCGIKIKPKFEKISDTYYPSEFSKVDQERFVTWRDGINRYYTNYNSVTVTIIELDNPTKILLINQSGKSIQLSELLFTTWKEQFGELIQNKYRWRKEEIVPGEFFTEYLRYSDRTKNLNDHLWAGIERQKIPLSTINSKSTNSQNARSVPFSIREKLSTTAQFIDLVTFSNDIDDLYFEKYLDSLHVEKFSTADINKLWENVDAEKFADIISAAIECVKAELIFGRSLELYDTEEKRIRPVTDFYLGKRAPEGTPLIEKQYGDVGRELGKLLNLPIEDDAQAFTGTFDKIFDKKMGVQTIKRGEKFYKILNNWSKWPDCSKQLIKDEVKNCLKKHNFSTKPFVNFNNPDIANSLKNIEAIVINLELIQGEIPKLKKLVKDLELSFAEELGEIIIDDEIGLDEQELLEIKEICEAFLDDYNEDEQVDLFEKFEKIGGYTNFGRNIRKTSRIQRVIKLNGEFFIPGKLPLFREKEELFFVSKDRNIKEIISELFSHPQFGLGSKIRILKDIRDALVQKIRKKTESEHAIQSDKIRSLPQHGTTPQEIGKQIQGALISTGKGSPLRKNDGHWNIGRSPEEEQEDRDRLGDIFVKSLQEGPEVHIKKLRSRVSKSTPFNLRDDEKIIDPYASDPRTYLKNEYNGGQCQICGTVLPLNNGGNYFETFRIKDSRGETWWNNRPCNILCLCPNHHALAEHGGRDFNNIYTFAKQVLQGNEVAREVPDFNGDFYVIPVVLNGENKQLKMSKPHMNEFVVLFEKSDNQE